MKRHHWFQLWFVAVVLAGVSCGQGLNRALLLGSWELDGVTQASVNVRYAEDSSYSMVIRRGDNRTIRMSGKWALDGTYLTHTDDTGHSEKVQVERLNKSRLTIVAPDGSIKEFTRVTELRTGSPDRAK